MRWSSRKNGISVLFACQNEEFVVDLSIRSFLDFGDELVIVDNGSQDRTKDIVRELESQHPDKIRFYDRPDLVHLYQNRQYALEHSSFRWIVRADADYVAYTDGEYDIRNFRDRLLSQASRHYPLAYGVPTVNVTASFGQTGVERPPAGLGPDDPGRYVPPPVTHPSLRIYEYFPGFRFRRLGRWEATSFPRMLQLLSTELDHPLWMHCNIKSELNYLYRSERTNWRELGDFKTYPTLDSYVQVQCIEKYGTADLNEAARKFLGERVYPFLQEYDPEKYYPYPRLVLERLAVDS
jgi:glycosyltransferase involved in cell wall biosynthesis